MWWGALIGIIPVCNSGDSPFRAEFLTGHGQSDLVISVQLCQISRIKGKDEFFKLIIFVRRNGQGRTFDNSLLCAVCKTAERLVDSVSQHIIDPCLNYASILINADKYVDNKNFCLVRPDRRAPAARDMLLNAADIIKPHLGKRFWRRCLYRIARHCGQRIIYGFGRFLALARLACCLCVTRRNLRIGKVLQHATGS